MNKSIMVVQDGKKFKVMVCYVQRKVFSNSTMANNLAVDLGKTEHIDNVILFKEN